MTVLSCVFADLREQITQIVLVEVVTLERDDPLLLLYIRLHTIQRVT